MSWLRIPIARTAAPCRAATAAACAAGRAQLHAGRVLCNLEQFGDMLSSSSVIDGYHPGGFSINNVQFDGPVVVLPELTLFWRVDSFEDMTAESLVALEVVKPKTELAISSSRGEPLPLNALSLDCSASRFQRLRRLGLIPISNAIWRQLASGCWASNTASRLNSGEYFLRLVIDTPFRHSMPLYGCVRKIWVEPVNGCRENSCFYIRARKQILQEKCSKLSSIF